MARAPAVLQDWRGEAPQALPDPRAGTARGCLLGAKYLCKLCQGGDFTQNFIYSSLCYFSLHTLHPSSKISRKVCLPRAKFSSALISSRTACRIHTQVFIHKTNAPVDSAQEMTTQRCTQALCAFCCCSANQIRFPCCLIHFELIKSKFRNEGNSSSLWER